MHRIATLSVLAVVGLLGLTAFRGENPSTQFSLKSQPRHFRLADLHFDAALSATDPAGDGVYQILFLNYSAYDTAYAGKARRYIQRQLPNADLADFWSGSAEDLSDALADRQVVVVAYPAAGTPAMLNAYGKVLAQFVRQGGAVIFTGTDMYAVLQQYGLFDLDAGYFCSAPKVHEDMPSHPVFEGTPEDFTSSNYAYLLVLSDPGFVTLADVAGYPVVGYKSIGTGKAVYLGLEYYFDEPVASRILANAVRWAAPVRNALTPSDNVDYRWPLRVLRRSEEVLYAGGGKPAPTVNVKIYPNPYMTKASLDFELTKNTPVALDVLDENARSVALLLPRKVLGIGTYHFELPNVEPGVYFVKCQMGERTTMHRVVKAEER